MNKYIVFGLAILRHNLSRFKENVKYVFYKNEDCIFIEGHGDSKNFGDALNVPFVSYLSNKKVLLSKHIRIKNLRHDEYYSVIGSIIQWLKDGSIIWGSGFISDKNINIPKSVRVHAVRGPLTRGVFLKNNIDCPEIYGDPALLLPFVYYPEIKKEFEVGFIPHYTDKNNKFLKAHKNSSLIIDVETGQNYKIFINQMLSCKGIVTSSLHGLILAHAYKIPVLWVKYSNNITGGNFKFNDYFLSVNKNIIEPLYIDKVYKLEELMNMMDREEISFNYSDLVNACPFIDREVKNDLLKNIAKVN